MIRLTLRKIALIAETAISVVATTIIPTGETTTPIARTTIPGATGMTLTTPGIVNGARDTIRNPTRDPHMCRPRTRGTFSSIGQWVNRHSSSAALLPWELESERLPAAEKEQALGRSLGDWAVLSMIG
jgi:hypothetical protein